MKQLQGVIVVVALLGLLIGLVLTLGSARAVEAASIDIDLTALLASAELSGQAPSNTLQFILTVPQFTVNDGDTVKARLLFQGGETFQLLSDPLSLAVGTVGRLSVADPNQPTYVTEFGFSFAFLDTPSLSIWVRQ